jgi:hypothetical protein
MRCEIYRNDSPEATSGLDKSDEADLRADFAGRALAGDEGAD